MSYTAKNLADLVNNTLDEAGLPANSRERASILSKMIDIPKQQAWALVEGLFIPSQDILEKIASELEIELPRV